MIRRQRAQQAIAVLASDLIAISAAFVGAFWLRFYVQFPVPTTESLFDNTLPPFLPYLQALAPALLIIPLTLSSARLYQVRRTNARVEAYIRLVGAVTFGMVLTVAMVSVFYRGEAQVEQFVAPGVTRTIPVDTFSLSRWFLVMFYGGTVGLTLIGRITIQRVFDHLRRSGRNLKRIIIAGTGPLAETVVDKIRLHEEFGFKILGMLSDDVDAVPYRGVRIVGGLTDARRLVRERSVDQIYVALPLSAHAQILQLLRDVGHEIVEVKVVPDLLQYITLGAGVEDLDGVPIVNLSRIPMQGFPAAIKRAFDLVVAGACLLLFLPLFPLIAVAVKLTSAGPVFYRQERMGLDGRPFHILKFRSMVTNAEQRTGPVWADDHDNRCTPIGALLRKLSLDELPQFWNIVRGDMSLVGPRPERPYFVDEFRERIPQYMLRHRVRSGLTGWAQVHGWRGNTSLNKRIEYDLYYIENWSLALDLKILWMTVTNGMVHEHAY